MHIPIERFKKYISYCRLKSAPRLSEEVCTATYLTKPAVPRHLGFGFNLFLATPESLLIYSMHRAAFSIRQAAEVLRNQYITFRTDLATVKKEGGGSAIPMTVRQLEGTCTSVRTLG